MANPYHWAVVVGIDQYPALTSLNCSRRDATAFHQWICDEDGGGLPLKNATLITKNLPADCGHIGAEPTSAQILAAIEGAFMAADTVVTADATVWERTRLYVYFSGHGIARDASDSSLLAADATPQKYGLHVSCRALREFFAHERYFKDLVIFADCCRDDVSRKISSTFLPWTQGAQVGGGSTRLLYACASEFGQKAYEEQSGPEHERRGYFTRCLLESLNNRKAQKGLTALAGDALRKRMKGLMANLSQQPNSSVPNLTFEAQCISEDEIVFGVTDKIPRYLTVLKAPDAVLDVRVKDGDDRLVETANRTSPTMPLELRLPLGLYVVEYSSDGGNTFVRHDEPKTLLPGYNEWSLSQ